MVAGSDLVFAVVCVGFVLVEVYFSEESAEGCLLVFLLLSFGLWFIYGNLGC